MDAPIPTLNISQVYPVNSLDVQRKRVERLRAQFIAVYGHEPSFIARSPGRVNLIGEHIDYSLYSVLPMALSDNDILIAVSAPAVGTKLTIVNVEEKFPKREFEFESVSAVEIDAGKHEWTNYFLSGYKGVLSELKISKPKSMNCLVDGTVPAVIFGFLCLILYLSRAQVLVVLLRL
jgi:galactokinase